MTVEFELCTEKVADLSSFVAFVESKMDVVERKRAEGRVNPLDYLYSADRSDLLFRGQSADWPLLPKLARLKTNEDMLDVERAMLNEFARRSRPFTKSGLYDRWDRLALAQHHGLPTRLLDWTYSATAALWFAVSGKREKDKDGQWRDGVVWILRPAVADFLKFRTKKSKLKPAKSPFEVADRPSKVVRTRIFLPKVVSERISAQSGVFTVHANLQDIAPPYFVPLEEHKCFAKRLVKIPIRVEDFGRLRKQLHACGINASTMYPDLAGLCQHLEWRLTRDGDSVGLVPE